MVKEATRDLLASVGLLDSAREVRGRVVAAQQNRYIRQLFAMYSSDFDRREVLETYRAFEEKAERDRILARFDQDRRDILEVVHRLMLASESARGHMLAATAEDIASAVARAAGQGGAPAAGAREARVSARAAVRAIQALAGRDDVTGAVREICARAEPTSDAVQAGAATAAASPAAVGRLLLDRLVDDRLFPHAYEYDYLDDIVPILESRYSTGDGDRARGRAIIRAMAALVDGDPAGDGLGARLRAVLGDDHPYVPRRGVIKPEAAAVIPDLTEEFTTLRAADQVERFLAINREYSRRRRRESGGRYNAGGLSLLVGYDRDHHAMVRALLRLVEVGKLRRGDEVLVVGPRHANELEFFRKHLGLRATGLDLFDAPDEGIVGGNMHSMPFETGRFKLVYTCATLSYAYAYRQVMAEMARVTTRPGYLLLSDSGDRTDAVDALGRTDPMNAASMIGCFYEHRYDVFLRDEGVSPDLAQYRRWPNVGIELL